jgi:hypothetical protein
MALAQALADFTLKVATPIVWYDGKERCPKRLYGGTCCFMRFSSGIVGVTACHVVETFKTALAENSNTVCQIRTSRPVALLDLIIDKCPELDIATFGVSEELIETIGAVVLDCTGDWQRPKPTIDGRAVTFCGFPEGERTMTEPGVAEACARGGLCVIQHVTERDVFVTFDSALDESAPWAPWDRALCHDMSGCSGGPVLSHGVWNGLQRWFLIAIIAQGSKAEGTGDAEGLEIIRLRRIDAIQCDGTIKKEASGWLPR